MSWKGQIPAGKDPRASALSPWNGNSSRASTGLQAMLPLCHPAERAAFSLPPFPASASPSPPALYLGDTAAAGGSQRPTWPPQLCGTCCGGFASAVRQRPGVRCLQQGSLPPPEREQGEAGSLLQQEQRLPPRMEAAWLCPGGQGAADSSARGRAASSRGLVALGSGASTHQQARQQCLGSQSWACEEKKVLSQTPRRSVPSHAQLRCPFWVVAQVSRAHWRSFCSYLETWS